MFTNNRIQAIGAIIVSLTVTLGYFYLTWSLFTLIDKTINQNVYNLMLIMFGQAGTAFGLVVALWLRGGATGNPSAEVQLSEAMKLLGNSAPTQPVQPLLLAPPLAPATAVAVPVPVAPVAAPAPMTATAVGAAAGAGAAAGGASQAGATPAEAQEATQAGAVAGAEAATHPPPPNPTRSQI